MRTKTYTYETYWQKKGLEPAEQFYEAKQSFILEKLFKLDFKSVLEYGCGDGELSKLLLRTFECHYEGFDISEGRLIQFEEKMKSENILKHSYKITQSDFRHYIPTQKVDMVICSHFLLHVRPEHILNCLTGMLKISNKYLVFFEPNFEPQIKIKWEYYNFQHDYFELLKQLGYEPEFHRYDKYTGLYVVKK